MSDTGIFSRQKYSSAIHLLTYLLYLIITIINLIVFAAIATFAWTSIMVSNSTQTLRLVRQSGNDISTRSTYVDHSVPQHHVTHAQLTLFVAYGFLLALWIIRRFFYKVNIFSKSSDTVSALSHKTKSDDVNLQDLKTEIVPENRLKSGAFDAGVSKLSAPGADDSNCQRNGPSVMVNLGINESLKDRNPNGFPTDNDSSQGGRMSSPVGQGLKSSAGQTVSPNAPPPVTIDQFLDKAILFGAIMIYFYLCDYYKLLPQGQRVYSRDTFLFLVFLLFLAASAFTVKANKDKILNREQTEEWKGWMQVMFVWYHYFRAKEWYNWIRVYIACYVWMTGFGNFSFFWMRKDFSMWRMVKMLFRLNFLVIFVAMVTNNEYMLYYICAMHTYWFLTVYVFMRVLNSWNTDRVKMAAKFVAYAVCNAVIFDIPGVSQTVFRPVKFVLGRHDHNDDVMHEWSFRAGLDHWACFIGMLCAYNYPTVEKFSNYLDTVASSQKEMVKKMATRAVIGLAALGVVVSWYFGFMRKEKYAYNVTHPYSSMLAILAFIVLRNLHPVLRSYHLGLFTWLGKVTLETYLSQLHIYLLANATSLVEYLPGYPLLNFSLATVIYLFISHCLFSITNDTSNFLISKDQRQLAVHLACTVALFGLSAIVAFGIVI